MSDTPLQKKTGKNAKNAPPLQDKRAKWANKKTTPNASDNTLIDSDASIREVGKKYLKENPNKDWFVPSYTPSDHDSPQAGPSNSKAQPVQKKGGKRVRAGPQKGVKKASQSSAKNKATGASKRKTRDHDEENKPSKVQVISIDSSDEDEEVKVKKELNGKIKSVVLLCASPYANFKFSTRGIKRIITNRAEVVIERRKKVDHDEENKPSKVQVISIDSSDEDEEVKVKKELNGKIKSVVLLCASPYANFKFSTRGIKRIITNRAEVVIERRKKVREDTPHPVQANSGNDDDVSEDDETDVDVKETKAKGVKSLVNNKAEESMDDEPMDVDSDADSDGNLKGFIVSEDELESCRTVQPKKLCKLAARAAKEAKSDKGKGRADGNAILGMKHLVQQNKTAASKGMAVATESDEEENIKKPDQDSASEDDNEEEQPQCYYISKDMQSHLEKGTFQETGYRFENLEWDMWNEYDIDQIMETVCYRGSEEEKLVSPAFGSLILCTKGTPALLFEPMWVIQSNLEVDSLQLTSDKLRGFKAIYGATAYQHSERRKAFLATSFKKCNLGYYTNPEG
ncbi:hypothetical protein OF83DRAFT_1088500, partial [Amylostereum chailletii]